MENISLTNKKRGWLFIVLAMLAFLGLGLEIAILLVEAAIYDIDLNSFNKDQMVIHWTLTCLTWGVAIFLLIYFSKKKFDFNLFKNKENVPLLNWCICALLLVISIGVSLFDWDGIKVVKEFNYHGTRNFIFQYLYYLIETILIYLILAFGQEAGENFFENKYIPYGGILVSLTWGLVHILTKGSLMIGIIGVFVSLLFGFVYLLAKKNIYIAFPFILLIFIL